MAKRPREDPRMWSKEGGRMILLRNLPLDLWKAIRRRADDEGITATELIHQVMYLYTRGKLVEK